MDWNSANGGAAEHSPIHYSARLGIAASSNPDAMDIAAPASGTRIDIGLVEDDPNVRAGMQRVIAGMPDWRLRFACGSLREARAANMQGLHLLLLDIGLPDGCGLDLLPQIAPGTPVLVISAIGDEATVVHAIEQGAAGYLLKDAHPRDLIDSIRAVLAGGAPISPGVASYLLRRLRAPRDPPPPAPRAPAQTRLLESLTPRETEVLRALTRGYSYEEAAALLGITRNTIGQHVKQIYGKLAVNSRSEAVYQAIQAGWVSIEGR